MLPRTYALNGGDSTTGRKLYGYFLQLGIPSPELRMAQQIAAAGDRKDLAAFVADPTTLASGPRIFQVWARR